MQCKEHGCSLIPTPGAPTGLTCPMCQRGEARTSTTIKNEMDTLRTENAELKAKVDLLYQIELEAEEAECAHMCLDNLNIPRRDGEMELSLVGRIFALKAKGG